ncbi:unnamed protein product [Caenorhabditis auriculariae]|uniref:3-hydroxyacyl-CoA dehydrogenase n=1 Tax=Caenorhabditis auriculariae TaxID=2777116 RepID=A0A8S1HKP2_9PELO|nr:unnamed protein product [Caenorhabditis auriculariae]
MASHQMDAPEAAAVHVLRHGLQTPIKPQLPALCFHIKPVEDYGSDMVLCVESSKPTLAVLGYGIMGAGIAQVCMSAGYSVNLYGRSEKKLLEASAHIRKNLSKIAAKKRGELPADNSAVEKVVDVQMDLLQIHTDIESAVEGVAMVIEAVVEDLETKLELFETVQKTCPSDCILLTNTSSLRLAAICPVMRDPSLFAGLHFFSPVPIMKLVEVVSTEQTSQETREALFAFCKDIGKLPVAAKDTPGFIVNRLLVPYLIDSIRMVERGDATKEDIDTAMRCGTSYPMGPIELCDFVGLDTIQSVVKIFHETIPGDDRFGPCELLNKLVAEGKLGRKTQQGFYNYKK